MDTILSLWYVWVLIAAIFGVGGYHLCKFINSPTSAKIDIVKKWLVFACIEAEKMFGSGTGKLKLLEVYNWFIEKFPAIAEMVTFETFSNWVSDALEEAQHLMTTNDNIKTYVEG